jgi:catechol 2,3-dioxygenase-like lactoylglutathione lyase family enzyme
VGEALVNDLRALSLLPFVPSGKDYDGSRRLFAELGFEEIWESGGYAGFRNGHAQFILQRFEERSFAENFMVRIDVPDLDAWWGVVSVKELEKSHPGFRIKPPTEYAWGREVTFIDLAGVCWHVGEPSER